MREIKFRAWNTEDKRMMFDVGYHPHIAERHDDNTFTVAPFLNFPLMQFTGLKDKNGKEIYEGDVVKWVYHDEGGDGAPLRNENTFEIKWVQQYCGFNLAEYPPLDSHSEIEIIGNIYENPSLLGDKQ